MKFVVVAVGDRMPRWVDEAFAEYAKRFPRSSRLDLIEVRPERGAERRSVAERLAGEARRLLAALPSDVLRVALDEGGLDLTTLQLAKRVGGWLAGGRDVAFVIGGPDGLDPGLKRSAALQLRLSSLTLPHALVRVLLAEQLYRALSILDNHPYHRGG